MVSIEVVHSKILEAHMYIEELKTFINLSKTKNFSKTANECHLVQSTVSNRIKSLENKLNVKLFIRTNKTVRLTNEGEDFLVYARRLLAIHENALKQLHSDTYYDHTLRVGTTYSVYHSYLSDMMVEFAGDYDKYSIDINITHSDILFDNLHDELLDIAFVSYKHPASNLEFLKFATDKIVCVTSASNKTYLSGINMDQLKSLQMLYCDILPNELFDWYDNIFSSTHTFRLKINVLREVIPYILKTNGYCFLPYNLVKSSILEGDLVEIPLLDTTPPLLEYFIVVNKKRRFEDAIVKFIDFVMN